MMPIMMPMIIPAGGLGSGIIPIVMAIALMVAMLVLMIQILMSCDWPYRLWNKMKRTYFCVRFYRRNKREMYNAEKDAKELLRISKKLNS